MSSQNSHERTLTYVAALREAVAQEMERDPRVFVMGLDVDDHKAIQGSTRGLLERFGPERVFGTPLSEDAMTGVAIGAAMAGLRPIHVHIRMDFLLLCMNQLVNVAAKAHYMYGGHVKVPLVVRSMIGRSWGQGAQHSQGLHGLFMHIPGLKVVAPSNAYDAKGSLIAAIRDDNPVIFVEHRQLYPTEAAVPEAPYVIELGQARRCRSGDDVTLVGISQMLRECLVAAELLREIGIAAEVIDPVSLVPLDMATIRTSARRTGRVVVVDNSWTSAGAGAEITAQLAESETGLRLKRLGYAPTPCPTTPSLEAAFYPDPASIAEAAHALLRPGKAWRPDPRHAKLAARQALPPF
ncbi:MAG TPA: transketolase C-terminal domain-containing protein [Stellaceae bacterium]|nr:transketolase C-terminal domain-containing protein [Stellaceae bacterium]